MVVFDEENYEDFGLNEFQSLPNSPKKNLVYQYQLELEKSYALAIRQELTDLWQEILDTEPGLVRDVMVREHTKASKILLKFETHLKEVPTTVFVQ
jgi:hypothetical protein